MTTITYKELARRLGDIFLFNKAPELDPEMYYEGIENGSLWENEDDLHDDTVKEIFQWYLITQSGAEYLKDHTEELVFYSNVLNEYVWGVTHWGTSWDSVELEFDEKELE